jgi:hypothetical protein
MSPVVSPVAAVSTVPIAIALVVALAGFAAWAVALTRQSATGSATLARPAAPSTPRHEPAPVAVVRAVIGPHYRVAAPDDAAIAVAQARRVPRARPDLRLVVDQSRPAPRRYPRSA